MWIVKIKFYFYAGYCLHTQLSLFLMACDQQCKVWTLTWYQKHWGYSAVFSMVSSCKLRLCFSLLFSYYNFVIVMLVFYMQSILEHSKPDWFGRIGGRHMRSHYDFVQKVSAFRTCWFINIWRYQNVLLDIRITFIYLFTILLGRERKDLPRANAAQRPCVQP